MSVPKQMKIPSKVDKPSLLAFFPPEINLKSTQVGNGGGGREDAGKKGWGLWLSQALEMYTFSYKSDTPILPSVPVVVPGHH